MSNLAAPTLPAHIDDMVGAIASFTLIIKAKLRAFNDLFRS